MTDFSVVAIIAAYNEGDIIGQVVGDLVGQGLGVYLLDHGSTDDTVAEAEAYLGQGLIRVERFPAQRGEAAEDPRRFSLVRIVRRKAELAHELDAAWFINHDADEFRESPWPHVGLLEGIRRVDALGYSAIDFEVLNFRPTHDGFHRGDDVRQAFHHYELGEPWDKLQIRCWKKQAAPVDLESSAGHEARFPGRRVFPLRFVLRHYPIRGQAHGERKVFQERVPRFEPAERGRGWHVQYEGIRQGHCFLQDPVGLTAYDPLAVRLHLVLRHRGVESLERVLAESREQLDRLGGELEARSRAVEYLRDELTRRNQDVETLRDELAQRSQEASRLGRNLEAEHREAERLRGELAATLLGLQAASVRLDEVYASRSWRWTAPLRRLLGLLGRHP